MNSRSVTTVRSCPSSTPLASRFVRTVSRRWPAVLGPALAALQLATDDPQSTSGVLLPLVPATTGYVVIAALVRPGWSWPVIGALVALVLATRPTSADPAVGLTGMVAIIVRSIVVGLVRGTWARTDLYRWQPYAAVAFLAISLGALWLSLDAGRVQVAAGLIGHAVWDFVHWRRHAVVSRSLSERCGALDLTLGAGVLVLVLAH